MCGVAQGEPRFIIKLLINLANDVVADMIVCAVFPVDEHLRLVQCLRSQTVVGFDVGGDPNSVPDRFERVSDGGVDTVR